MVYTELMEERTLITLETILTLAEIRRVNLVLYYDSLYNKYIGEFIDNYGHLEYIEEEQNLPQLLHKLTKILE